LRKSQNALTSCSSQSIDILPVVTHAEHDITREQDLQNYLALHDYSKAISLALAMEQPGRLFKLLQDVRSNLMEETPTSTPSSLTGHPAVDEVLRTLESTELTKLLSYLRDWNTRAKTSAVAQGILYAILKLRSAEDIMSAYKTTGFSALVDEDMPVARKDGDLAALKDVVDAIIPYTERHLTRMDKLIQESYVIDYLLSEMDTVLGDMEEEGTMDTIEPAGLMDVDVDDDDEDL
jgi:U3 small nucleolar RNA-associated protein 13